MGCDDEMIPGTSTDVMVFVVDAIAVAAALLLGHTGAHIGGYIHII